MLITFNIIIAWQLKTHSNMFIIQLCQLLGLSLGDAINLD